MNAELVQHARSARIALEGDLTIDSIAGAKSALLASLAHHDELVLDLHAAQAIDTAGLQVLALLQRESLRGHKTLQLLHPAPALVRLVELLNLRSHFGASLVGAEWVAAGTAPA